MLKTEDGAGGSVELKSRMTGFILMCALSFPLLGQAPPPNATTQASGAVGTQPIDMELNALLQQIDQLASSTNMDMGRLRLERWKTDQGAKRQTETNMESVQRNLTAALPEFVSAVRKSPREIGPSFRLYRNLSALYDVLSSVVESAGAFGPKSDFERLASDVNSLDSLRISLGKRVEGLADAQSRELAQLRQAKAQPVAPAKVVVDDNTPPPAKSKRKKPAPAQQQNDSQ